MSGSLLDQLDQWRKEHDKAMRPILIFIVAIVLIGCTALLVVITSDSSEGASMRKQCNQSVVQRAREQSNMFNRGVRQGFGYTNKQRSIIRNNPACFRGLTAPATYEHPNRGWHSSFRGIGGSSGKSISNCWKAHVWKKQESYLFHSDMFTYHYYARVCFYPKNGQWWVRRGAEAWTRLNVHDGVTIEDQGGTQVLSSHPLPDSYWRSIESHKVCNCVVHWGYLGSMNPAVDAVFMGPDHWYYNLDW